MIPIAKLSLLKKYNLKHGSDGTFSIKSAPQNISWKTIFDEVYYHINKDFFISKQYNTLKNRNKNHDYMNIETIFGTDRGLCYKIVTEVRGLYLEFHETLLDIPKVEIFLTSEKNSYGVVRNHWFDGKPFIHTLKNKMETRFLLKPEKHINLQGQPYQTAQF